MATSSKSAAKPVKPKAVSAARKPAAPAKATAKAAPAKAAGTKKPAVAKKAAAPLTADQRRRYVEVAAYYIAERRGFQGGNALDDWAAAEAEVERLLREGILNT